MAQLSLGVITEKGEAVALSPEEVRSFVDEGYRVLVQRFSGQEAGINDAAYVKAGAVMRFDAESVARDCDLMVRLTELDAREGFVYELMEGKPVVVGASLKKLEGLLEQLKQWNDFSQNPGKTRSLQEYGARIVAGQAEVVL